MRSVVRSMFGVTRVWVKNIWEGDDGSLLVPLITAFILTAIAFFSAMALGLDSSAGRAVGAVATAGFAGLALLLYGGAFIQSAGGVTRLLRAGRQRLGLHRNTQTQLLTELEGPIAGPDTE